MQFWTVLRISYRNLRGNKTRSTLTILGIIIGVMSVIAMLALGAGTREKITQQVRNSGANLFSVRPSYKPAASGIRSGTYVNLKLKDAEAILQQATSVDMVCPDTDEDYQVKYGNKNTRVQVNGDAATYFKMRNFTIEKGRQFTDEESERHAMVAVLGPKTAEKLFEEQDPIGETVKIKGLNFRVIGVTRSKDDRADDNVWVPLTTNLTQLQGIKDSVQQIYCHVRDEIPMQQAIEEVSGIMRRRHAIQAGQTDDFQIRNNQEVADQLEQVSNTFTILLASVAGISLLIGGINIMNIMLVTVTERTREIGIRKALGARYVDLLTQFLLEAVMLSMAGGLIGVALGAGSVVLFNKVTEKLNGEPYGAILQAAPVVVAFSFSAFVGIFFGWYPAQKAARLDPIDALRWE
jgi:putative ABC transport system permease protein